MSKETPHRFPYVVQVYQTEITRLGRYSRLTKKKVTPFYVCEFQILKLVRFQMLRHCKSCKGHDTSVLVMDQDLIKAVEFSFRVWVNSSVGREGGGKKGTVGE